MGRSRRRRRGEHPAITRYRATRPQAPRVSYAPVNQVIEQVHFGKKPYRAGARLDRAQALKAPQIERLRRELRRRARAKARSLNPSNALKSSLREVRDQVLKPHCKPRPDPRAAGRSPKRKRGLGGASVRNFIPWCKG